MELAAKVCYKNLAIKTAANLIASFFIQSEFITYEKGEEIQKENYYLFNYEPNQNQSASSFWRKVVTKMILENHCLVVQINNLLYVADDYTKDPKALIGNFYRNINIGDYALKDTFEESQVLYFELNDSNIKTLLDTVYYDYGSLVEYSKKTFKRNNAKRGTLTIPTNYPQTNEAQEKLQKLMNEQIKSFYEAENGAVLPLTNGITYDDLSSETYKNSSDSRDIKNIINDIFDFVAMGFQIPPQLLKGTVSDSEKVVNRLLVGRINPIAKIIADEINRKYYGKKNVLEETHVKVDTSRINITDIKELATAIDIFFRTGTNTINDNLKLLGRKKSNDPIADKRFVTKNYQDIKTIEGGEENREK